MSLFVIADLHLSFGCNKPMDVFPAGKTIHSDWNKIGAVW